MLIKIAKRIVHQLFNNYIGVLIEVSIKVVEIHEVVYKIYLINVLLFNNYIGGFDHEC